MILYSICTTHYLCTRYCVLYVHMSCMSCMMYVMYVMYVCHVRYYIMSSNYNYNIYLLYNCTTGYMWYCMYYIVCT